MHREVSVRLREGHEWGGEGARCLNRSQVCQRVFLDGGGRGSGNTAISGDPADPRLLCLSRRKPSCCVGVSSLSVCPSGAWCSHTDGLRSFTQPATLSTPDCSSNVLSDFMSDTIITGSKNRRLYWSLVFSHPPQTPRVLTYCPHMQHQACHYEFQQLHSTS